jgi:Flp pilus assembly protein CpaB
VTIEVVANEAEKVSVAATLGRLAVVIRSATDPVPAPGASSSADQPVVAAADTLVWSSDVSAAFRSTPRNPDTTVHLFNGSQAAPVEYHY